MKIIVKRVISTEYELSFEEIYYDGLVDDLNKELPGFDITKDDIRSSIENIANGGDTDKEFQIIRYLKDYLDAGMYGDAFDSFKVDTYTDFENTSFE